MTIGTMATKFDTGLASLAEQLQQLRLGNGKWGVYDCYESVQNYGNKWE
jgi:hypothetical protein